ncbi:MAG: hypothetical protein HZB15_16620, partial [Actinobacteria bacterium]|nr:hypothetical protein [Actinomycetota bacterium]
VADSAQDNVTSLPGWTGGYVTIAGPLGTSLVGVSAVDPSLHGTPPAGYTLPDGLLSFTLDIGAASQATVRIFTPSAGSVNGYAKFHDGVWSLLPASNVTVDPSGDWVDVTLVDGGIGDDDEVVNGTIVDPGGVVLVADNVAPAVTCAAAPTTWSKTDISIACTATDAGSGLAQAGDASFSLSTSVPDGTETANASTGSRSVCDVAGNCSSVGPFTGLKVDKQAPSITITSPTGADVNRGQTLTARYSCADAGSGVATCAGPVRNNSNINTSVAGQFSFTVNATDRAGNTSTTTVPYRVLAPNAAPTVRADMGISGLQEVGFQSRTVTLTGSFADPDGTAPYTASVQWAAGAAFTPASVTGNQIAASFTYPSAGTRTVTVKVCDVRGACGTDTVKVRAGVTVKVTPVVQCVTDRGSRQTPRYEARFGYTNPAGYAIVIPTTATENTFTSSPSLRGQPQIFRAGTQRNVFTVGFASGTQSWRLNGTTVSASPSTRRC